MTFRHGLLIGVAGGLALTLFTSLIMELILLCVAGAAAVLLMRRRWRTAPTPSKNDEPPPFSL